MRIMKVHDQFVWATVVRISVWMSRDMLTDSPGLSGGRPPQLGQTLLALTARGAVKPYEALRHCP